MADLEPDVVTARLAALRELYVPETVAEGQARMERERPVQRETFDARATRCLRELRALDELTRHLHRKR